MSAAERSWWGWGLVDAALADEECLALGAGLPGLPRTPRPVPRIEDVVVPGFSLMLHGLRAEHSLRLQRAGLGLQHKRGCGIFVQHRSVAPLSGD